MNLKQQEDETPTDYIENIQKVKWQEEYSENIKINNHQLYRKYS